MRCSAPIRTASVAITLAAAVAASSSITTTSIAAASSTTSTRAAARVTVGVSTDPTDPTKKTIRHADGSVSVLWTDTELDGSAASSSASARVKSPVQTKGKGKLKVRGPRKVIVKERYTVTAGIPWKKTMGKTGKAKRVVAVQVKKPGSKKWRTVKKLRTGKVQSVTSAHRFTKSGTYAHRFVAPKRGALRKYTSPAIKVKVAKAPVKAPTPKPKPTPAPVAPTLKPVTPTTSPTKSPTALPPTTRPTAPTTPPTVKPTPPPAVTFAPAPTRTLAPTLTPKPTPKPTAGQTSAPTITPSPTVTITYDPSHTPEPEPIWTDPPAVKPSPWTNAWDAPELRGAWEPAPVGDPDTWTWVDPDDKAMFSTCKTVTWAYNPDGGFDGSLAIMKRAVARIAGATGLRFKFVGTTNQVPFSPTFDENGVDIPGAERVADIRIGWQHEDAVMGGWGQLLRNASGVAMPRYTYDGTTPSLVGGEVLFNIDSMHLYDPHLFYNENGRLPKTPWGQVMQHEIGHVVGLGHVSSGPSSQVDTTKFPGAHPWGMDQIMHRSGYNKGHFGASDLAGLAHMGTNLHHTC